MSTNKPSLGQAKHTLEILDQQGIDGTDMRFLHDGVLSDFLEGVHLSRGTCFPTRDELRVFLGLLPQNPTLLVDYDLSFKKMVAVGQYDHVVDHMGNAERYTGTRVMKGKKKVKIQLHELLEGELSLPENRAAGMAGTHFRLASFEEILAFGATYPKVQLRCRHGVFGKAYGGISPKSFQPNLWSSDGKRGLSFEAGGVYCNPGTYFLFVER